jgi:hypothetical protein
VFDSAARGLSKATGGTDTQAGMIDVSPESLKFWQQAITGGSGTFLYDITHLGGLGVRALWNMDDPHNGDLTPERKEIPILRDYSKQQGVTDSRRAFWDATKEAEESLKDLQRAAKAGDQASVGKIMHDRQEDIALAKISTAFGKMVKYQRDQVDKINSDPDSSLAYKRAAIKVLERQEQTLYDRYLQTVTQKGHEKDARLANGR